jgi:hypothetical protein
VIICALLDPLAPAPIAEIGGAPNLHGQRMLSWARANAPLLHLAPEQDREPVGFHPVFRVGRDGQLLVEVVLQFAQRDETPDYNFGGVPLRGGSTVVIQANGKIRYIISKPIFSPEGSAEDNQRAKERMERQRAFVQAFDEMDSFHIWKDLAFQKDRRRGSPKSLKIQPSSSWPGSRRP